MALGPAACLGSVDRAYSDGGADTSPATGDDATVDVTVDAPVDAPAESAPGMDGGGAQDGDAMMVKETAPTEASPPTDAPVDVVTTGQTFDCNGTMVTSCASCPSKPVECVFCANNNMHPGVCGAQGMYCSNSAPGGAAVCTCNGGIGGNLAACPAPFQVCTYIGTIGGMYYCQSCGEMGSDMGTCKGGGRCSAATETCN
jgi:hypothetical protein